MVCRSAIAALVKINVSFSQMLLKKDCLNLVQRFILSLSVYFTTYFDWLSVCCALNGYSVGKFIIFWFKDYHKEIRSNESSKQGILLLSQNLYIPYSQISVHASVLECKLLITLPLITENPLDFVEHVWTRVFLSIQFIS